MSAARGICGIAVCVVGSCICIIARPTWVARVRCVASSAGVVGEAAKVAISAGAFLQLVVPMLYFLIRGLCLNFYFAISIGCRCRCRCRRGCNRHYGISSIPVDDLARRLFDLEIGRP
jgi:hypothetical protein